MSEIINFGPANEFRKRLKEKNIPQAPAIPAAVTADEYPDVDSKGKPLPTVDNLKVLCKKEKITVRYNMISKKKEITVEGRNFEGDNTSNRSLGYIRDCVTRARMGTSAWVKEAVNDLAADNSYNPVKDWIDSVAWDGVDRVQIVCDSVVIDDSMSIEFKEILIKKWLVSAAAAIYVKGFHGRGILTLQGPQGIGKTTWLRTLAGDIKWFGEGITLDPDSKDTILTALSRWICELGEVETTFKKELGKIKAFVTKCDDSVRKPYGAENTESERRTIFAASVNGREFLRDETGNSRWWCLPCVEFKSLEGLDVQQMWAQVKVMLINDKWTWWLTREEDLELAYHNEKHEPASYAYELIGNKLAWYTDMSTWEYKNTAQLMEELEVRPGGPLTNERIAKAVNKIFKDLGITPDRKRSKNQRAMLLPPVQPLSEKTSGLERAIREKKERVTVVGKDDPFGDSSECVTDPERTLFGEHLDIWG